MKYLSETSLEQDIRQAASGIFPDDDKKAIGFLESALMDLQSSVLSRTYKGVRYYPKDESVYFVENWIQAYLNNDASYLLAPRGLTRKIVDVEEFACSSEYLGLGGSIRYRILQELKRLNSGQGYIEVVLGGGIGIGKNFFADIAILYDIYKLSCLKSPQLEYGLAPGSSIVFVLQSINETLARKVVFRSIRTKVLSSPYFKRYFPPDPKIKTELIFPNNISVAPITASDTSALGTNVFGGYLDEINYHPKRLRSQLTVLRGDSEYDKATILYQTMRRRMKSRFMMRGSIPGRIYLVASANYPQDFISRKIEEAKEDKTIFVMNMPQWESHRLADGSLDPKKYSGHMFTVDLGNAQKPARILADHEDPDDIENTIQVPVEYLKDFTANIDDALRDIAGMPRSKKTMFMPAMAIIKQATKTYNKIVKVPGRQLFYENKVDISVYKDHQLRDLVDTRHIDGPIRNWREYGFVREPAFGVHIDAGLSDDCCGIAVGRVLGLSEVNELRSYIPGADKFVAYGGGIKAPIIFIDGILSIRPPTGDEIDLTKVQGIIFTLIKMGVNIRWLSMDRFASPQMLQMIRKYRNVSTRTLSVDHPLTPYMDYKILYKENRIIHPNHPDLIRELRNLELDRKKGVHGKVDHPVVDSTGEKGSKDLADAVCGVTALLINLKDTYRFRNTEPGVNQYALADIPGPDVAKDSEDYLVMEEEQDTSKSSRRSARNPERPRRGATRRERATRFRHRML